MVVTIVGMVICLAAGDYLMGVIKYPLKKSGERSATQTTNQMLVVMAGSNVLARTAQRQGGLSLTHGLPASTTRP